MRPLFGEFLIAKGLATEDAVVEALIEQMRAVPGTAELVHAHRLLGNGDLFRILAAQQRSGGDFRATAAALGLWTPAVAERAGSILAGLRRPLGEILVKSGRLTLAQLASALDDYVAETPLAATPASPAGGLDGPASPPSRAAASLDPMLAKDFAQAFTSQFEPSLAGILKLLIDKDSARSDLVHACRRAMVDLIGIESAARFFGAELSASVAQAAAATFEALLLGENFGAIRAVRDTLALATAVLAGLAQCIDKFHDEGKSDDDPNLRDLTKRFWLKAAATQALCRKVPIA